MSIATLKAGEKFSPSNDLVRLGENALLATAHAQAMTEVVTAYQRRILADGSFIVRDGYPGSGTPVMDPSDSFRMDCADFRRYLAACKVEEAKAGLKAKSPEHCPKLEAEVLQIDAERALIEAFAEEIDEPVFKKGTITLKIRENLLRCIYSLLAPKIADAPTIMKRIAA